MVRNISLQKKGNFYIFKLLNTLEENPVLVFCVLKLLICMYMNPVASVSVRQSKKPLDCLLFFSFPPSETSERWLIDARALPLDALPAWMDLGWDRKDKTPSQPPKTPVLK